MTQIFLTHNTSAGMIGKPADPEELIVNDRNIREVVNGELDNENLRASAGIVRSKLASDAKGIQGNWYTPKIIATEQTTTSTSYTTLSTADEITGVVLPENGLIAIGYSALAKTSSANSLAAIFLGSNQLHVNGNVEDAVISTTEFKHLASCPYGLQGGSGTSAIATTGETISSSTAGGLCYVFAAAGTYTISIKYKVESGKTLTAKERKLWVYTLGV